MTDIQALKEEKKRINKEIKRLEHEAVMEERRQRYQGLIDSMSNTDNLEVEMLETGIKASFYGKTLQFSYDEIGTQTYKQIMSSHAHERLRHEIAVTVLAQMGEEIQVWDKADGLQFTIEGIDFTVRCQVDGFNLFVGETAFTEDDIFIELHGYDTAEMNISLGVFRTIEDVVRHIADMKERGRIEVRLDVSFKNKEK